MSSAHTSHSPKKVKFESGNKTKFQEYWKFQFGVIEKDGKAMCFLCKVSVVSKAFCVKRHFTTNHKDLMNLNADELKQVLQIKLQQYENQSNKFTKYVSKTNHLSTASFQLAYQVAKAGKSLSEGEFLKQTWMDCSSSLFYDFPNKEAIFNRIKDLPASRGTVKERIVKINEDVEHQLISDLSSADFYSICVDDSKDINSQARLVIFIRYEVRDCIREEPLKLMTLTGNTTGEDICNSVLEAFTTMNLNLSKVVAVTTDGAPSMIGKHKGFVAMFKRKIPHPILGFHCIIHQEALWSKSTFLDFEDVMRVVTKIVNFIAARPLNNRLFKLLLEEVQSQYSGLLMYNDVRWLSRGKVLQRFVASLEEIRYFLLDQEKEFSELTNVSWLTKLMFFADFSHHYNALNLQLQGKGKSVDCMFSSVKAFAKKLIIFEKDLLTGSLKYFPLLHKHLSENSKFSLTTKDAKKIFETFAEYMQEATERFQDRFLQFKEYEKTFQFVRYPYQAKFEDLLITDLKWIGIDSLEMELVDFQASFACKTKFETLDNLLNKIETGEIEEDPQIKLLEVWNNLPDTYQSMKKLAKSLLTVFSSSYTCEQYFSSMNMILSKTRNRLTEETSSACITLKATNYNPRFDVLSTAIRQQRSH